MSKLLFKLCDPFPFTRFKHTKCPLKDVFRFLHNSPFDLKLQQVEFKHVLQMQITSIVSKRMGLTSSWYFLPLASFNNICLTFTIKECGEAILDCNHSLRIYKTKEFKPMQAHWI